jgi:leucyl-tRNA synthetase
MRKVHQTIKRVTDGLENFSFNTSIAGLMALRNELKAATREQKLGAASWSETVQVMLRLMAPFTPHIAEELWAQQGQGFSIHQQLWPVYDAALAAEDVVTLVFLVNGKVRDREEVPAAITQDEAYALALERPAIQKQLNGTTPKKVIFIPGRADQGPKINLVI